MSNSTAADWIQHLQLTRHIEGGWYREVYRSQLTFPAPQLPAVFNGTRHACTHIYFLLEKAGFSAFHRIKSDELWHFYAGDPVVVYEIDDTGLLHEHRLGNEPEKGQSLSCVVRANNWFGSRVAPEGEYGLVGCTVAPGFDFDDFEMAERSELIRMYPQHAGLIGQMTV